MKKLMRKLVLSCFALGLAVVTLTTTTFAWYTSNTDVSATDIVGTASTSGEALLMISDDGEDYGTSVAVETESILDMIPLEYKEVDDGSKVTGITFNKLGGSATAPTTNTGFLEFSLWLKLQSSEPKDLHLTSLVITNTSGLITKDVLAGAGQHITGTPGDAQPSTYKVDVLRTLLVSTETVVTTNNVAGASVFNLFDPEGLCTITSGDILTAGFNAHEYYNKVMELDGTEGKTPIEVNDKTESMVDQKFTGTSGVLTTSYNFGTLPTAASEATKNDCIKITFRIFINGWDLACFDAVQGQTIAVSLTFAAKEVAGA